MRIKLKPNLVNTSQKPKPISSVAPVTTAQLSFYLAQYRLLRSGINNSCLKTVTRIIRQNLVNGTAAISSKINFQYHYPQMASETPSGHMID